MTHNQQKHWYFYLMFPFAVLATFVCGGILILIASPYLISEIREDHRIRKRLKQKGRFLDWSEVQARLANNQGCLLIGLGPKGMEQALYVESNLWPEGAECPLPKINTLRDDFVDAYKTAQQAEAEVWFWNSIGNRQHPIYVTGLPRLARKAPYTPVEGSQSRLLNPALVRFVIKQLST